MLMFSNTTDRSKLSLIH